VHREWDFALGDIDAVAAALAPLLEPYPVVALSGELGAGKTTLVQALCRQWGVTTAVTSPTYTLEHIYTGSSGPIHHVDAYRLESTALAYGIGLDETLASGERCLIEWPERVIELLPPGTLWLHLAHVASHVPGAPDRRHLSSSVPAQP